MEAVDYLVCLFYDHSLRFLFMVLPLVGTIVVNLKLFWTYDILISLLTNLKHMLRYL